MPAQDDPLLARLQPGARTAFERFLESEGLTPRLKALALAHVHPAFWARVTPATGKMGAAASRVGGEPDVPLDFQWPLSHMDGHSMVFLAQVRLSDLPVQEGLPKDGHLAIFMDIDEPPDNTAHRIFYWPEGEVLERRSFPGGQDPAIEIDREGTSSFTPCVLSLSPGFALDAHLIKRKARLTGDDPEPLLETYTSGTHLLGTSVSWSEDPRVGAYLISSGMEGVFRWKDKPRETYVNDPRVDERMLRMLDDWRARPGEHQREIEKWQLLFAMGSETSAGMCWWDAGCLQFLIHEDDLAAGNYSRTYCHLATS